MGIFDDLSLLRGFVAIVESGSISAAARKLHTTQPTLSRQLQALEALCGTALLMRDTHRMSLTDTGHRVFADAQGLLAMADDAQQRLREDQTALQGNVRVFSTIDFGQSVVSRLISSFLQANPAVTVDLAYSNRPLHMIEEGCDFGVVAGALTDERMVARSVGRIRRSLVASPEFLGQRAAAARPADLQDWPWLALANSQFGSAREVTLHSRRNEQSLEIHPVLVSEGVTSLREAARMGLGVAVLPDWLIDEDLVGGRLVRVLPQWLPAELEAHVVYPLQRRLPLRVRTFIDFATEYMVAVLGPQAAR